MELDLESTRNTLSFHRHAIWLMDEAEIFRHMSSRGSRLIRREKVAPAMREQQGGVAVIDVQGVMMTEAIYADEVDMPALASLLRAAASNDAVSAVVLNIDSPGGMAVGMSDLSDAAAELAAAKPLFAHAEYLAASAGYWLASKAQTITAGPDADLGSIGVRTHIWDWSKFFENAGVTVHAIDTGAFKSMGLPGTPVTEQHREFLQERVDSVMQNFAASVRTGRGMNESQFKTVADARVFMATQALELNLIDGVQSLSQTIADASAAANSSPSVTETKTMSEQNTPQPATLVELKQAMPASTAEFREAQIEAGATLPDALAAFSAQLAEDNARLQEEKAEADKKAAAAEQKAANADPTPPKRKGHQVKHGDGDGDGESSAEELDYRQMALDYMNKYNCRWSEACLEIKKRHPAARDAFGAPPAKE